VLAAAAAWGLAQEQQEAVEAEAQVSVPGARPPAPPAWAQVQVQVPLPLPLPGLQNMCAASNSLRPPRVQVHNTEIRDQTVKKKKRIDRLLMCVISSGVFVHVGGVYAERVAT